MAAIEGDLLLQSLIQVTHRPCVGSMLGQRRRRWPNIEPTQVTHT